MAAVPLDASAVTDALSEMLDPESGRSVVEMEQVRDVKVNDGAVSMTLDMTTHSAPLWDEIYAAAESLLHDRFPQATSIEVRRGVQERPAEKLGEIGLTAKSVVAVGSGKGGVGKSTVATSIAYGLRRAGCRVGLLDADVFGPSVPQLTGTHATPEEMRGSAERKLKPVMSHDIPIMSIGYLVPPDQAVIWRGPMLHSAVTQFLRDTEWGDLDYLIIDMPPGTGDVPLTLSQVLPLSGSVVVCTPQEVALLDAVKAIAMFRKVNIPIIGMVENMSGFICPDCNKRYDIFGSGGAKQKAAELGVPFLGEIPITVEMRQRGDEGNTNANFDDARLAPSLTTIARQMARELAQRAKENPPGPSLPVLG